MASQFDESDFVDSDFVAGQKSFGMAAAGSASAPGAHLGAASAMAMSRPPSREEIESKVNETQVRLAELRRAQEELERERAALEESRRKRIEFANGRAEMLDHLTRGVGLLEEAEFAARRDAEQMKISLEDMRAALGKVQTLREEAWTEENWQHELTRALTTLENARMEWNSARLKWTILDGALSAAADNKIKSPLDGKSFSELCRLGLALNWPVALVSLVSAVVIIVLLLKR
jgi:hypothetical protein